MTWTVFVCAPEKKRKGGWQDSDVRCSVSTVPGSDMQHTQTRVVNQM